MDLKFLNRVSAYSVPRALDREDQFHAGWFARVWFVAVASWCSHHRECLACVSLEGRLKLALGRFEFVLGRLILGQWVWVATDDYFVRLRFEDGVARWCSGCGERLILVRWWQGEVFVAAQGAFPASLGNIWVSFVISVWFQGAMNFCDLGVSFLGFPTIWDWIFAFWFWRFFLYLESDENFEYWWFVFEITENFGILFFSNSTIMFMIPWKILKTSIYIYICSIYITDSM